MRKYELYLIEENVALHYNGKEKMIYNLFFEHTNTKDSTLKAILKKQIDYITRPIPEWKIQQVLLMELQKKSWFQHNVEGYYIKNDNLSSAMLSILNNCLQIKANGYYDAELVFFELLHKYEPNFLAIDIENGRYGWLKPIKQRNFV
ncbi:sporulation inhibitor of replication protein SirA [Niallia nealsonii]|uniref:Sporulation inhibitor of replication protein SirA n=1 Tax=Niallia nealsonii TaxID=115979 RepID=A0A2N0YYM3_9BACI|nr:sporulation inhibitor of replication protein SirA [Niallia nealsonii]PKG22358.1 sporulation inhibitor of replication protein SirA [Niallia nealsonii]